MADDIRTVTIPTGTHREKKAMSQTLLGIEFGELAALSELLDEIPGGEITDEVSAIIEAWFAEIGEARESKIEAYCHLIRSHELRASIRSDEADRIKDLAKRDGAIVTKLRERLKFWFELTGTKKVETPRFRVSLSNVGGSLPVEIDPGAELNPQWIATKVTTSPDRKAIHDALKSGVVVPGCRLGERQKSLRIE